MVGIRGLSPSRNGSKLVSVVIKPAAELELVGGAPILELVNTQEGPRGGEPGHDFLRDYGELVAWGEHVGILDGPAALAVEARRRPEAAAQVLDDTRALRAAAHAVFSAVATHAPPPGEPLAHLDTAYAEAVRHARLAPAGPARFDHVWDGASLERRAVAARLLGRRPSAQRPARPGQGMRRVSLALHRLQPQPQPALVHDEHLRREREDAPLPGAQGYGRSMTR